MNRREFLKSSILGSFLIPSTLKAEKIENKIDYSIYYELGKRDEYSNYVLWTTETKEDKFKKYYNITFITKIYDSDSWNTGKNQIGEIHFGLLNEKLFNTIEKKIYYLKGVFDTYSGQTLKDGYLEFIRSEKKFERCGRWIGEIANENKIRTLISPCSKIESYKNYIYLDKNLINYIKSY